MFRLPLESGAMDDGLRRVASDSIDSIANTQEPIAHWLRWPTAFGYRAHNRLFLGYSSPAPRDTVSGGPTRIMNRITKPAIAAVTLFLLAGAGVTQEKRYVV